MTPSLSRCGLVICASALVLAACASSNAPSQTGAAQSLPRAKRATASQYIKNVIVIIQENRSFENIFMGYPGANAPTSGCALPPKGTAHRSTGSGSGCPYGDTQIPLTETTFKHNADPEHDWKSSIVSWDNGNMDGFSKFGGKKGVYSTYSYLEQSEVQPYWDMAQQYVLSDAMFPTEHGGSFTAHLTLVAGTDDIALPSEAEVNFPTKTPDDCDSPPGTTSYYLTSNRIIHKNGPFPCFTQFNTIAQVLDGAGVSWKMYATKVLDGGLWEPFEAISYVRYGQDWPGNIIAPQRQVLKDAANGNLAAVNWVTPTHGNSDHPAYLSDTGPSWVSAVVNAIGKSSYWSSSAIIVVWDDWGGWYDNAPPPQLDYRGLGIRVPCLIISPYAKQGYVDSTQYEFGSILGFIEEVNGLTPGSIGPTYEGYTDGRGATLDDAFNFYQTPRKFTPIPAKYPAEYFLRQPAPNETTSSD